MTITDKQLQLEAAIISALRELAELHKKIIETEAEVEDLWEQVEIVKNDVAADIETLTGWIIH